MMRGPAAIGSSFLRLLATIDTHAIISFTQVVMSCQMVKKETGVLFLGVVFGVPGFRGFWGAKLEY
jgi:vacuolar-type H+-ATPase subunit I/STV1